MTDRELLELAAKAAGIHVFRYGNELAYVDRYLNDGSLIVWNPLTDSGQALELAVKLGLFISHSAYKPGENAYGFVRISWYGQRVEFESEKFTDDPYAATRRAIVRAAAQIGKNMK